MSYLLCWHCVRKSHGACPSIYRTRPVSGGHSQKIRAINQGNRGGGRTGMRPYLGEVSHELCRVLGPRDGCSEARGRVARTKSGNWLLPISKSAIRNVTLEYYYKYVLPPDHRRVVRSIVLYHYSGNLATSETSSSAFIPREFRRAMP